MYGLDIETDTTDNGLDPGVAAVVSVAVVSETDEWVLEGDESSLLVRLDALMVELAPGILITWNGGGFDLPFLSDRAALAGVELGLRIQLDPKIVSHNDPLPGHKGSYRASWHQHSHLDGYRVFRSDAGAVLGLPCGLKPMARLLGLNPIEVDRETIHLLGNAERQAYVASDARVTRQLVLRRWQTAQLAIDKDPRPVLAAAKSERL